MECSSAPTPYAAASPSKRSLEVIDVDAEEPKRAKLVQAAELALTPVAAAVSVAVAAVAAPPVAVLQPSVSPSAAAAATSSPARSVLGTCFVLLRRARELTVASESPAVQKTVSPGVARSPSTPGTALPTTVPRVLGFHCALFPTRRPRLTDRLQPTAPLVPQLTWQEKQLLKEARAKEAVCPSGSELLHSYLACLGGRAKEKGGKQEEA
jgi:hypothetical protein